MNDRAMMSIIHPMPLKNVKSHWNSGMINHEYEDGHFFGGAIIHLITFILALLLSFLLLIFGFITAEYGI